MHSNTKQKGMIEMILLLAGVLAIVGVGVFFVLTMNKAKQATALPTTAPSQITDSATSPNSTTDELQAELEGLDLGDIDSDFKDIDEDLSSL